MISIQLYYEKSCTQKTIHCMIFFFLIWHHAEGKTIEQHTDQWLPRGEELTTKGALGNILG